MCHCPNPALVRWVYYSLRGRSSCGLSYIIGASSSEEVTGSLMEQSFPHAGRKSLMWHGIPLIETVLAVDSHYRALTELRRASSVRILYPDTIFLNVWARNCIVRHQHYIDTLNADLVGVGCVCWCSQSCFIILQCNVVPIHCLHDWALHSCSNASNCAMGPLNHPIPWWNVGAPKSYIHTPCSCKLCKSLSTKCSTIISKQLNRQPPFTKHHFKLLNDISRALAVQGLPNGKTARATVYQHQV